MQILCNDQIALLASLYYKQTVSHAIGKLYGPDMPELNRFNKLVGMGLVKIRRWNSSLNHDGYLEAVATKEGVLSLKEYGPERITQALLTAKDFTPLEFYVKELSIELLPEFLTCDVTFIRVVAKERYAELNGGVAGPK